ncbi:hypothetical protein [Alicyclobacillus dauci]|uniref:HTH HARE-type domain-containing protein n=1 Tax=Alicyclobacillus dauci TaxID=1475485 RepID=A0ABY6YZN0_9BACL|nr:hypothetical protein [Alicyclobacillus dauci]WAH35426.1 hypothetical protein NZD86_14085 [Alicyclobacillus dauci]
MSWTQGQPPRGNQSPFIDPPRDNKGPNNHTKPNTGRNDRNQRQSPNTSYPHQNMSNVAATFTQEGLETFSLIFSSAVEAAIAKSLPEIVERAVKRSTEEVLNRAMEEMERVTSNLVSQVSQCVETAMKQTTTSIAESEQSPAYEILETEETAIPDATMVDTKETEYIQSDVDDQGKSDNSSTSGQGRLARELESVIQTLKDAGRPIKTDELRLLTHDVQWGTNPSVKMSNLVSKSKGQIERVSRGVYQYKTVVLN